MSDLEFFFDPGCPWAWITSRWVTEVQRQRAYDVRWRFISLWMVNEQRTASWYTPEYRAGHYAGHQALRVADQLRLAIDNEMVGRFYTAVGTAFHHDGRRPEMQTDPVAFLTSTLAEIGADDTFAAHIADESHDEYLRADTELAFSRTGRDVGTPILTFHPGAVDEGSFFGPVIAKIPRGQRATELWDAIELIATSGGVAELKRSNRGRPDFS